jgi:hypothetical protein
MKFLYPYFLFALTAVAVPILIHLFNFRRYKTVYFSNVEFLKNIKKESRRKSKLKQLLILLARILAIISLVFAFAQPYIPLQGREQKSENQAVAVYIDNSFSMNARGEEGLLLETARNKAIEIVRAFKPGTRFMLITNDRLPVHTHFLNSEQFIQEVSEVISSPEVISLSRMYNRLKESFQALETDVDKSFYFLSDFQRQTTDMEAISSDSTIWAYLFPITPQASDNLYIDSCWFETPSRKLNDEEELFIKITNNSDQDYQDLPLKFYLNDSLKSLTSFTISAHEEVITRLKYTNLKSGFQRGKAELTDYPMTYDNTWFLSYHVQPQVHVLAVTETSGTNNGVEYFRALMSEDPYAVLEVTDIRNLQVSRLADYNTLILVNLQELASGFITELEQVVANGASVLFFPSLTGDIQSYNRFLSRTGTNTIAGIDTFSQALGGIALENPVYQGIFRETEDHIQYPEIHGHLKFNIQTHIPETNLLWFRNQDKALGTTPHGNGFVHVFSFPVNKKNDSFARDILFVPTIYSLILNSIPKQQTFYTIGKDPYLLVNQNHGMNRLSSLTIRGEDDLEFIPDIQVSGQNRLRIGLENQIKKSGFYAVEAEDSLISVLAFNYDRSESDLTCLEKDELEKQISAAGLSQLSVIEDTGTPFSEIFKEIQNGKQLWKWFIGLSLLFIALEAFIIRFWK